MVDRDKIIVMTKLAVYDKNYGARDRKINEYYRSDYIYRNNMWNRLCVFFGCVIVILFYWLHKIFVEGVDVFTLNYKDVGINMALFILAVMAFYTLIGTAKATMEYAVSQKRLRKYEKMLTQLDRLEQRASQNTEEASDLYYGADFTYARNHD